MAGKYQAYTEYKEVQLDWLGEIPSHWEIKKLKFLGKVIIGLTYSPNDIVNENEGVLVLRSSNIQNKQLTFKDNVYVKKTIPDKLEIKPGDVLICSRNGSRALIGKNVQIHEPAANMTFGAFMSVFRSPHNCYLSKVFNSTLFEYQSGSFLTSTINQLTTGNLNSFEVPLPPLLDQIQIANFLDHETAKIDTLIEKQQQLIKLLKEKRQAVISHAVTKGLNPDTSLKSSGVEWLGDVPEHWIPTRLKYMRSPEPNAFVDGPFGSNLKSEHFVEDGDAYVIESNFATTGIIDIKKLKKVTRNHFELIKRSATRGGDIIIAKIGARYGSSAILPELDKDAVVSGNSLKLTVNSIFFNVEYANELLRVLKINDAMDDSVNVTAQPALSLGGLKNLPFLKVPINEQNEIVVHTNDIKKKFNDLISNARAFIYLVQERRTALISAAVTGKIDVRNWQPPEPGETQEDDPA